MIIRIDTVSTTPIYVQLRNEIVKGIEGENSPRASAFRLCGSWLRILE